MKITWVIRSFLDYHIPVFEALDKRTDGNFSIIYADDFVPPRVSKKAQNILGSRAIGLTGEWQFGKEDFHYKANALLSLRFHPGLMKAIKKTKPEVLIGDGFFKWTAAVFLYKIIHKVPTLICYERTMHTERNAQWYRIAYRKFALRWVDAMCCNGKLAGEYVQSLGYPANKIAYGHMVADVTGLKHNAMKVTEKKIVELKTKHKLNEIVFLFVGQLSKRKGIYQLLESWANFEHTNSVKSSLLIVGKGPEKENLLNLSKKLNLSSVRFVGAIDYDNIAIYYAAADVFIIPTLEDNWSLVVPEAMACGLPILCSKYNGCWPELIHQDKNGWIFDPLDSESTVKCLNLCIENKNELTKMGINSQEIVKNYSPEKAAGTIIRGCEIAMNCLGN